MVSGEGADGNDGGSVAKQTLTLRPGSKENEEGSGVLQSPPEARSQQHPPRQQAFTHGALEGTFSIKTVQPVCEPMAKSTFKPM